MRLEENHENWLKFANDYWELDNGRSAVELGKDMIMKHIRKARDSAYGYTGELDEAIAHADRVIEATDRNNLKDTVDSLCDLGHKDKVVNALKNVTLTAVHKNINPVRTPNKPLRQIAVGANKSPVRFNGTTVKRSPQKAFDAAANKVANVTKTLADSVNVNAGAKNVMREAMERKAADGRLNNPTPAAATIKIPANRVPNNKEKTAVTKFYDDEETTEGLWSANMKREAVESGRMKSGIPSQKSVERPVVRLNDFNETRDRLPPEFRNPKELPQVIGMTLADLPKPPPIEDYETGKRVLNDPVSMAAHTQKNHQMQQHQWAVDLKSPAKPKQGFDPVNGAI